MVPIRSQTPIKASRLVETIGPNPKSPHKGTKCGIRPKLETPHTKNVKASTQNVSEPDAVISALMLITNGLPAGDSDADAPSSPYGAKPRSAGRSRAKIANISPSSAIIAIGGISAPRPPSVTPHQAAGGRKTS